jgi:rod shape-determining protein MreC
MLYGLLAVVLMAMDHRGRYVPKARELAQYFIEPVYHVVEWPVGALRNLFGQFQSQRTLRHENERLEHQLLSQQGRLQRMETLREENQRLRALFEGAESQPYAYQFAELIQVDLDPFAHRVLIDRGARDGVESGQAVIDGQGVMGQVEEVHLHFASVRLISDPSHALPVQINRTGLRTVAFGQGETQRLSLPNVPREADVRVGDLIVTSGLGERFPGGYPVAQVATIDREEGQTFARVEATPLAALDRGREVLLIRVPPVPDLEAETTDDVSAETSGDAAAEAAAGNGADAGTEPEPAAEATPESSAGPDGDTP